jgi:hypothetical protein
MVMAVAAKTKKETITIVYNGEKRLLHFNEHEAVQAALEQALNLFDIHTNRHLMALFAEGGAELTELHVSLKDAGVEAGDELFLGQSTVRGG